MKHNLFCYFHSTKYRHRERPSPGNNDHSKKKIVCNETGEIFDSITSCATILKIPISSISNHLRGREKYETVHGHTFKYLN